MQLHQLRYVVCVAEERRFTRAAARLHVAQPSISSAVAALEQELGAPLFHRERAEVTLTGAGEVFLPWARQVLADCDAGAEAVRDLLGLRRGRLVIGATPSLTTNLLPPVLARFHTDHAGVELTVHEAGSQELVDRLGKGEMDLAVVILPVDRPWVEARPLMTEELVLAVDRAHRLAARRSIRVAELEQVPLVMFKDGYDLREATLLACRQAGFTPIMAMQGLEMDGALALAAAGVAAAVVPASVVAGSGRLRAIRFRGGALERTIGLASRRDRPFSPAASAFVDALCGHLDRGVSFDN
ncbi:MAG TPA: LysR substrate-binding domain-containing protein [Acidimicrobiales bacterium]|nr:LysR substrate-binding domain-containing protein [Acidimicrobiales bacterium]